MTTRCPACGIRSLTPTRLEHDLPALGCVHCGGALLSLVSWRSWREHASPAPVDAAPEIEEAPADSGGVLRCPKCERFMTKYRFAADVRNHIDFCAHCDEIWLDHGEWDQLEQFAVSDKLAKVFSEPWQNRVRNDAVRKRQEDRWREQLGSDYERAKTIRAWLAQHPKGKEMLAYLYLSQTEGA
jgi:Zn-finger nucleic acid-binding protein